MKRSLYIIQDGELKRRDNSLYFESGKGRKFIPVENTNDIYILGNVDVSKRFLEFASQKQICVHYFEKDGLYMGTFYPREYYSSGHVIVKQIEHYINDDLRLILAKKFASGATGQMIRVLKYYSTRISQEDRDFLNSVISKLEEDRQNADGVVTIKELEVIIQMAKEKYNSTFYYVFRNPYFNYDLTEDDSGYHHINSIIAFGESMCHAIILSEIYKTYLDPRISYLHTIDSCRFVLNLDLVYIFKPIMIDRLVFTLINKKIIGRNDFVISKDGPILSRAGKMKFIKQLDDRMRTTVNHRHLGRSVSYRRLIRLELYKLQKHILGEHEYKPYQSLW